MSENSTIKLSVPLLCAVAAVFFFACVEPPSLELFLNDERVAEIVITQERVILLNRTGDPLAAGNGIITGLNPDRYYIVEELDEFGVIVHTHFVGCDGTRRDSLGSIGRVTGGAITGLTNGVTYVIRAAAPLFATGEELAFFDMELCVAAGTPVVPGEMPLTTVTVDNGAILLPVPDGLYYINLAPAICPNYNYEVMLIPVSTDTRPWCYIKRESAFFNVNGGSGTVTTIDNANFTRPDGMTGGEIAVYQFRCTPTPNWLAGMSIMPLQGQGTVSDYLFVERDRFGNVIRFNVLRVTVGGTPPDPGGLTITVEVNMATPGDSPYVSADTGSLAANGDVVFTVSNFEEFTSLTWFLNNVEIGAGSPFTFNFNEHPAKNIIGFHAFTVEGIRNGVDYSSSIFINVVE